MNSPRKVSWLERIFSKQLIETPVKVSNAMTYPMQITWELIDKSTENYAHLLHEFNMAEIIKAFIDRFASPNKIFQVLPKSANLDLKDTQINFHDFYAHYEAMKEKLKQYPNVSKENQQLHELAKPIISYLLHGKHNDKDKKFSGWSQAIATAKRYKKTVLLGTISIDLPVPTKVPGKYKCAGTQHYVAFAYDITLKELLLFDSATKDDTELTHILKYTFEHVFGEVKVTPIKYRNVLQPGAGDRRTEDERSYNNQNVFCHSWSLWFLLVVICFYRTKQHDEAMKFLKSLSHRNPMLNLAMIKRFAGWLTTMLVEDSNINIEFPERAYERSRDERTKQRILEKYVLDKTPYIGLNYIYNYKTNTIIPVNKLCTRRKIKMDVDILERLNYIDINNFINKSKEIQCEIGFILNPLTKRCKRVKSNSI